MSTIEQCLRGIRFLCHMLNLKAAVVTCGSVSEPIKYNWTAVIYVI